MKLLTTGNPKIAKGEKLGYLTNILHLAPADLSGFNVCPKATAGCKAACLNTAGRGGIFRKGETTNAIQKARIARTVFYFNERPAFMAQLVKEIKSAIKLAEKHKLTPVFRLNGTSDLRWENVSVIVARGKGDAVEYANIFEAFPTIQFYDYTKLTNRVDLPANYHLTFSLADGNDEQALEAFRGGMNVAGVFFNVPKSYKLVSGIDNEHIPVINGDESDLRFLDLVGVLVGLKAKGKAKKDTSGFVK